MEELKKFDTHLRKGWSKACKTREEGTWDTGVICASIETEVTVHTTIIFTVHTLMWSSCATQCLKLFTVTILYRPTDAICTTLK